MGDRLEDRIGRIHAALGAAVEKDMAALPATVSRTPRMIFFCQDFSGGQNQAELDNLAHSLIYNVAHLYDHLRKWAKTHDRDPDQVDQKVKQCTALQIVCDLSNVDKHGGHGRTTWSGRKLSLTDVTRVLRLTTRPEKGSRVAARLGRIPVVSGDGTAEGVLTGQVLDENGGAVGDLHKVVCAAVAAWECLLEEWGVIS